jgi:DNA polymerase-3 subunit gamma/tau
LSDLDAALNAGVDAGVLIEQLFGCLRDCMVAAAGCPAEAFLYTSPSGAGPVTEAGKRLGLNSLLAVMQILDQTLFRMRYSTQGRILAELALVRISQLEDLDELGEVIGQLRSGASITAGASVPLPAAPAARSPAAAKKKYEPAVGCEAASGAEDEPISASQGCEAASGSRAEAASQGAAPLELTAENAVEIWNRALERLSGMVVEQARQFDSIATAGPNRLVIRFKPGYAVCKSGCERPEQVARFEQSLAEVTGQPVRVAFALSEDGPGEAELAAKAVPTHQRLAEAAKHPLVRRAGELFGAQPVRVDDPPGDALRN